MIIFFINNVIVFIEKLRSRRNKKKNWIDNAKLSNIKTISNCYNKKGWAMSAELSNIKTSLKIMIYYYDSAL